MTRKPYYSREEFKRIYEDVKNMRQTGATISDCCDFSEITINRFNYYVKKYGFDSLRELKYPYDSFKQLYDKVVDKVKDGMTITAACKSLDFKPSIFYNCAYHHKMPNIVINNTPDYDYDYDKVYEEIWNLVKEGYTVKSACKKQGISYSKFYADRAKYNKPIFKNLVVP